jgi:hypothetical protein
MCCGLISLKMRIHHFPRALPLLPTNPAANRPPNVSRISKITAKTPETTKNYFYSDLFQWIITMPYNFCTRFTLKERRFWHPRNYTERLGRFLLFQVSLPAIAQNCRRLV